MQNNLTEQQWRHHTGASSQYIRPELLKVVEREESIRMMKESNFSPVTEDSNFVSHIYGNIKLVVYTVLMAIASRIS
jgi:hypothetical protein